MLLELYFHLHARTNIISKLTVFFTLSGLLRLCRLYDYQVQTMYNPSSSSSSRAFIVSRNARNVFAIDMKAITGLAQNYRVRISKWHDVIFLQNASIGMAS